MDELRKHWKLAMLTWSYAYFGIFFTLSYDIFGRNPPQVLVLLLMAVATIVTMMAVQKLRVILPFGKVFLLWGVPCMAIWIAFVFGRAFIFGLVGREL